MWFTRVSLKNPVFATMIMLALVVLGAFSYQRLQIDQFPNIDFPVVVVTMGWSVMAVPAFRIPAARGCPVLGSANNTMCGKLDSERMASDSPNVSSHALGRN